MSLITKLLKKNILDTKQTVKINDKLQFAILSKDKVVIDGEALKQALKIEVPKVTGMSIAAAVKLLQEKGIKYELKGKEVIPKVGSVYSQSPEAGTFMTLATKMILYVNNAVDK